MPLPGGFGERLRRRREDLALSQEALAEAVGVSVRSVIRWEHDEASPHPEYRQRLARALGLDVRDLAAPGTTEPAPDDRPSIWHVPLRRNPFFTGRELVLERLVQWLGPGDGGRLYALTGMGGIGKTQTALEYAYRHAERYSAVFWLPADTREGCLAALGELAIVLDRTARRDQDYGRILAMVGDWFRRNAGWLLVLDDLEDPALLDEVAPSGPGSTLVTTRSRAIGLAGGQIDLLPLSRPEGTHFLLRRAKLLSPDSSLADVPAAEREAAEALVNRLDGLPLALDQAAAYLEETGCGLDVYLDHYRTQHIMLLGRRGRLARDHPDSVEATIHLAYRRVRQTNPAAGELLCLCANLHPDGIPEEILGAGAPGLGPVLGPVVADPLRLDEALADLATLSLVRRDTQSRTLTIHRLVQDIARATLPADDERLWAGRAVTAIACALPGSEPYEFSRFLRFVSQAVTGVEMVARWRIRTADAARLLDRVGVHHQLAGRYAAGRRLLSQALRMRQDLLGRDHLDTAESLAHLAELAVVLGRYRRADVLASAALGIRQEQLEPTDLLVGSALGLVGMVRTERGRYRDAAPVLQQALEIQTRNLGREHPEVAETLSRLAEVSFMQGHYVEAERLLRQALAINVEVLGPEHLVTGTTAESLGTLYRYWGRNEEAAVQLQRALEVLSQTLGDEHPSVMTVLNGLARAKHGLGQTAEAEPLARRAMEVRERVFGPDHPKLAYSLQVLSEILLARGRYAEAERLARRGLAIRERIHGEEHQTLSISVDILAQICQSTGDVKEADVLYRRALTILERTVGNDHPRSVGTLTRYAALLEQMHRPGEAAALRARAAAVYAKLQQRD